MTEEQQDIQPDEESKGDEEPEFETTGNDELDERLAEPILKGQHGIDSAQVWMAGFLVIIAGVIAYSNGFSAPFQYEDITQIVNNTELHHLSTFPDALNDRAERPLTVLSFALCWAFSDGNPSRFHMGNIILHVFNGLLVFLLCRRLLKKGPGESVAMLAGLLFVLHPANTECVMHVVGRAQLMGTFFGLLSVLLYLRATSRPEGTALGSLGISLLAFVCAWASNPVAVGVPFMILIADWVVNGRVRWGSRVPAQALYWVMLIVVLLVQRVALEAAGQEPGIFVESGWAGLLSPVAYYVKAMVAPVDLCVVPFVAPDSGTLSVVVLGGMALVGLAFACVRGAPGFALVWLGGLLGVACLMKQPGSAITERHAYLPLAGGVMLVPWLFSKLPRQPAVRTVGGLLCAGLVFASMIATYQRNGVWLSEERLWNDAAAKNPAHPEPQRRLGTSQVAEGERELRLSGVLRMEEKGEESRDAQKRAGDRFRQAEKHLRKSLELDPAPSTMVALGKAVLYQNKNDEALTLFLDALGEDPSSQECTLRVAQVLQGQAMQSGERAVLVRSLDYYGRAEALGPLNAEALTQYGIALASAGRFDAAEDVLSKAAGGKEDSPAGGTLKQVHEAAEKLRGLEAKAAQLLAKNPDDPEGLKARAQSLLSRGQALEASYALERLLRAAPADASAWVLMGAVRAAMNQAESFLREYPEAPISMVAGPSPWMQLARNCASTGRWDAALAYLSSAGAQKTELPLPLVALGNVALGLGQAKRAVESYQAAAKKHPNSPEPWLALCDFVLARKDLANARKFLAEAEKRGASADVIAPRREKAGTAAPVAPFSGMIR